MNSTQKNNEQKDALTKIFTGQVGGDFFVEMLSRTGELLGIRSVPIEFNTEGKKRRKIKIPAIAEMEIEGLAGSDPNIESKVVNFRTLLVLIPLSLGPLDIHSKIMV